MESFDSLVEGWSGLVIGSEISSFWISGKSGALHLEIGRLRRQVSLETGEPIKRAYGEFSICMHRDWRISGRSYRLCHVNTRSDRITTIANLVVGSRIESVEIISGIGDIALVLDNGISIASFAIRTRSPAWFFLAHVHPLITVYYKRGRLIGEHVPPSIFLDEEPE